MYVVYTNVYDIHNIYMFFVGEINAYMQVYLGPFTIGVPKMSVIEKGLHMTTLDFCLSYIIIIEVDCCMPIDKMMSSSINKNI